MPRYRVLVGHHQEIVNPGPQERRIIYGAGCAAGDVFESNVDMLRQNAPGMSPKFALVDQGRGPESEADLERRIAEDQKKLDALRVRRTTAAPAPAHVENVVSAPAAPPTGQQPQQPTQQQPKPNPHQAPKAESDAVRQRQLMGMSVKQLQDIAAEEEIDVSSCKTKEDYVRAILK